MESGAGTRHQTSAKGSGRDQAAELGLPSGGCSPAAPETGENTRRDEALLRPAHMTTPLHAVKGPFKVPSARRQRKYVLSLIILIFQKFTQTIKKKREKEMHLQPHTILSVRACTPSSVHRAPGTRKFLFTCCQYSSREGSAEK